MLMPSESLSTSVDGIHAREYRYLKAEQEEEKLKKQEDDQFYLFIKDQRLKMKDLKIDNNKFKVHE